MLFVLVVGPFYSAQFQPLHALFVVKWLSGQSSCVFGYAECMMRKCKREEGYINTVIDGTYDVGVSDPVLAGIITGAGVLALLLRRWL